MANFTDRLGYHFKNPALLELALRHCSAGKPNNERMEFLGDAVLGFIISDLLYHRFPSASEGELSRLRAQLVQRSTLAAIARELCLNEVVQLGLGELKSGGAERESILADAMEALLSALYLDGGLPLCQQKLTEWLLKRLPEFQPGLLEKDPKTRLQELLQARKRPLPAYTVVNITGTGHQQEFTVECKISLLAASLVATGSSRKEAEQAAATLVLQALENSREQ